MGSSNNQPPPAPSPSEAVEADINTLEARRLIDQAARMGTATNYDYVNDAGNKVTGSVDFTGMGDQALASNQRKIYLDGITEMAPELLALRDKYGVDFVNQSRKEIEASDPEAFALRKVLGEELLNKGYNPQTENESTANLRAELEEQVASELSLGGELTPEQRREMEQNVLNRQARTGMIRGNAPALMELTEVGQASENRARQRRTNALTYLNSGMSVADTELKYNNYNNNQEQSLRAEKQAFTFGQPLSAQFAQVTNAQRGTVPINPVGYGTQGVNLTATPVAGNYAPQYDTGISKGAAALSAAMSGAKAGFYMGGPKGAVAGGILGAGGGYMSAR